MGSSRLPGKVLMDINGKPMLLRVIERAQAAQAPNLVVVATSTAKADDAIEDLAHENGFPCFRGSELDVLDRYYRAAQAHNAEVVVRLTADCPLHDPSVIDNVTNAFTNGTYDYASNTQPPTFPDGLDTEVFAMSALERAWEKAALLSEREHVTPYIRNHPELFKLHNVASEVDYSQLRWTVDEAADLEFVRAIYRHFASDAFGMAQIVKYLHDNPDLNKMNAQFQRNEGYQKSLREDGPSAHVGRQGE